MRRRWGLLGVIVAVAVGAAALGWIVGREVQSPEDAGSDSEPPEPSLIAVPVESRVLNSNVVVRGDIRFSESEDLTLDPGIAAGVDAVVTGQLPGEGEDLIEGDVFIEVSGRPVIALVGELPMFRTLGPGSTGDDVQQLEEALARLGYDPGPIDNSFDGATETAIEGLYRDRGYAWPGLDAGEVAQLRAAEDSVDRSRDQLRDAEADLARASEPLPASLRLQLEAELISVRQNLDRIKSETQSRLDAASTGASDADAALDAAVAANTLAVDRLAQAEGGTHPDTGLPASPGELASLAQDVTTAQENLDAATLALSNANHELASAIYGGADQVAAAQRELDITVASQAETLAAPDTTFERRAVDDARTALEDARTELAELDFRLGTEMPKSEAVFLDILPRRIDRVLIERGDTVRGPVMRISGAEIVIDSSVAAADRPLVSVGDRVIVDDEGLGIELEGQITELADTPGGLATGESRYYVQVVPQGGDPLQLRGLNVRLTIPIESTDGAVLAVPLAALSAGADGTARVQVEREPGLTELVTVVVGLSADGFVEVQPIDGSLVSGDDVVVGRE